MLNNVLTTPDGRSHAVTGGGAVAQQGSRPRESARFFSIPRSPLENVSKEAWARFVGALESQLIGDVSESGGLGAYDIRPRRLVELGYATGLRSMRNSNNRQIHVCEFAPPWTQTRFLADPIAQYVALSKSISLYYAALMGGVLKKPDISIAGALAVLHRGGRGALLAWPNLFENTRALYEAARGAF